MNRGFQFRLLLSTFFVVLVAVAMIALWVNRTTRTEFDLYLQRSCNVNLNVADLFLAFYEINNDWKGIEKTAGQISSNLGASILLVDEKNNEVVRAGEYTGNPGKGMNAPFSHEIIYEGKKVGTIYIQAQNKLERHSLIEQNFLSGVNRSLIFAVIASFVMSLFLSLIFSRKITESVTVLSGAAEKISHGDFSRRVNISGHDELSELGEAFNYMAEKLEDNSKSRQNMFSDIAHELRTPLSAIRGYIEGFDEGVIMPNKRNIQAVKEEVLFLTRLIDDLRELSLAEAGELKISREEVNVSALVKRAVKALSPEAEEKNIKLSHKISKKTPEIHGDFQRLSQVLRNLISNSLSHTPPKGKITVSTKSAGNTVVIEVTDTGKGIDAEDLPYVFERFYRAAKSRPHDEGRVGLGLAIARELVLAHGGKIEAEIPKGKGTRIRIELPAR